MSTQLMEHTSYGAVPLYIIPMYGSYSCVPPAQLREQSESDASESDVEDGSNVYYTGMDPNATKDYVIGIFNKFGAVSDVKILIDRSVNRCRGAGLVRFATRAEAEAAIEGLAGTVLPNSLNGSAMQLRFADTPDQKLERRHRNRRTRGGKADGLPKGRFDPVGPHPPNRTPSPSAHAPVSITLNQAQEATESHYFAPYGMHYALPPIMGPSLPIPSLSAEGVPQYTLYVTNLAASSDEGLLYQIFALYGAILSVKIARTISGLCKGYAFVNFLRFEEAARALMAVNGVVVDEKPLIVTFASSK
eukprot:Mycagemm_TRINITY_DN6464_c0_g1::TRINITY_DN6464_c0_g1_i1::g.4437::m.4437 type:complete len:304 gc:universal TRINITY_DN6464_c0_g1_i1:954-43(-)